MVERKRHFQISVTLTLLSIAATEVTHHILPVADPTSAGFLLLGLVPIAYGALRAGLLAGLINSALLSAYVLHYTGPHDALIASTPAALRSLLIMFFLGAAMSWPMSIIRQREERFRRELEERSAALVRRNDELVEVNAALESFGYVVSHDLKEPVRAIENYLAAAKEEWGSPESRRFVQEAHDANRRLARMLQGLLEYSRASATPATLQRLSIQDVLQGDACRGLYEHYAEERRARIEVAPGLPSVLGDELLIAQLMGNLLLNAVRHNPADKPVVRVEAADAPPGRAHIVISDNGPGYPPEVLQRFSRLPERGAATVKTGFGLVIAQRAARRLNGNLWLENGPQGGAQAHLELPAAGPE